MKTAVWILSFVAAGLLIVVFLLSRKISQLTPGIPADGTACTIDGAAGTYLKGVCVKTQTGKPDGGLVSLGDMVSAVKDKAKTMALDITF